MTTKTSDSHPIQVDFIPQHALGLRGRIGMTFAPGKKHRGAFGEWDRDLGADLKRLGAEYGTRVLVSLVQDHELEKLGIPDLFSQIAASSIRVIRLPIVDGGVPKDMSALRELVTSILNVAKDGGNVVVHCRGGLGRTGLVAACCLVAVGVAPTDAIKLVRQSRARTIETHEQEQFVHAFAKNADRFRVEAQTPSVSRFLGSLLAGAVGDSLGYPVEFVGSATEIFKRHGETPPRKLLALDDRARVSDDTQMTLFSAEAIIRARQRSIERGISSLTAVSNIAYQRWLSTQDRTLGGMQCLDWPGWLVGVEALHARRAPGNTCMSALHENVKERRTPSVETPPNDSKGCGAVMRSAPFGLAAGSRERAFIESRDAAVLTHGHPSGYLSAAYFASVIYDVARDVSLEGAMRNADALLVAERGHEEIVRVIERVRVAARKGPPTAAAIEGIGGGWVGEEALGIALLCALTADGSDADSTARALWSSVAHAGDSDSTGSLTGNILGAMHGLDCIPKQWLADLEMRDVIERIAGDLHASSILGTVFDFEGYPPN